MKTVVLPWRHDSELAFVRDCFYPQHNTTNTTDPYAAITDASTETTTTTTTTVPSPALGLRRVNIWTFQSPRNVPRAVTATAKLIDAKLHDARFHTTQTDHDHDRDGTRPRISQDAMNSIYAMAFTRFVNAFVDRDVVRTSKIEVGDFDESDDDDDNTAAPFTVQAQAQAQARAAGESSMYAAAITIGMPAAFVGLRHRCVHGDVPGLVVLRAATDRALEWLWTRWWRANARGDPARFVCELDEELAEGDGGLGALRVDL